MLSALQRYNDSCFAYFQEHPVLFYSLSVLGVFVSICSLMMKTRVRK